MAQLLGHGELPAFTPMTAARLVAVFCQLNTVHGNRYLDDAGRIMNLYEDQFPQSIVGVEGLRMMNPTGKLRELRVTTEMVWAASFEPDTIQWVTDHVWLIIEAICATIDVHLGSRFGLRAEFFSPMPNPKDSIPKLARALFRDSLLQSATEATTFEAMIGLMTDGIQTNLRVKPVRRIEDDKLDNAAQPTGLLYDVDVFRESSTKDLKVSEMRKFFRDAQQKVKAEIARLERAVPVV